MNQKSKVTAFIILAAIILFHLVSNYIWLKMDNTYLLYDSHWHFLFSLRVFDEIKANIIPILSNIFNDFVYHRWHGIFVGYVTAPFYFIFGTSEAAGVMINGVIFLTILVFSTYGIGKRLCDEKCGLLSAFTITMYPLIFNHLKTYMLDLPLTSMVTLSIYLLLLSDNFTNRKYSLLFGVAAGLGMLTKFTFAGFIIGPLSYTIYRAFLNKNNFPVKKNILFVSLVFLAVVFTFYKLKFWEVLARVYGCSWIYAIGNYPDRPLFLFYRWAMMAVKFMFWSLKDMVNNSISFLFSSSLIIILPFFFKKRFEGKKILYSWLLFPLFFLGFVFHYPNINRYMMPLLPAIAIITGIGIAGIKRGGLKKVVILTMVTLSIIQYLAVSYNIKFMPKKIEVCLPDRILGIKNNHLKSILLLNRNIEISYRNNVGVSSFPSKVDWKNEEILNEIINSFGNPGHRISLFFVDAITRVYEPIAYRIFVEKYPVDLHVNSLAEEELHKDRGSPLSLIVMADYLIISKQEKVNFGLPVLVKERITQARKLFEQNIARFKLIREFKLEDGTALLLFKNNKDYAKISKGKLKLYFRDGATKLYFDSVEITRYLGLKTSFKVDGKEYLSETASWDIVKPAENNLTVIANWQGIPVSQRWEINILDEQNIIWKVWLDVVDEIKVNDIAASLILSERYREWFSANIREKFGSENILAYKYLTLKEAAQGYLGVRGLKKANLPEIIFSSVPQKFKIVPVVGWKKNARVLGFAEQEIDKNAAIFVGEQSFFSGKIKIGKR